MKLKNNALQELYDTLVGHVTISVSPHTESSADRAFRECDEKLQKDIDIWKCGNEVLASANTDLVSYKKKLEKEIEGLQEHIDILSASEREALSAKKQLENEFSKLKEHALEDHKIIASVNSDRDNLQIRAHRAEDKVEELMKKCKTLQDRNDILEKSNGTLLGANIDLCSSNRDLKNRVKQLEKELDEAKSSVKYFRARKDDWRSSVRDAEEAMDNIRAELEAKVKRMDEITKELVDTKIQLKFSKASNDDWQRKANNAGKQIEELKATLEKANSDRTELQKSRDSYHDLYTELSKTYNKLSEEKRKLNARTDCLRAEVKWYRNHYKEKSDKIQELKKDYETVMKERNDLSDKILELKSRLNSMCGDKYIKSLQDRIDFEGYKRGQTDLWDMLQNVNDVKPWDIFSFYPDVSSMDDIISWDIEDFLDEYKKWQEEKEVKYMRDYLERFCMGKLCYRCPLHTAGFNCSRGKWLAGIPDKDIKRYYDKARGGDQCTLKLTNGKLFVHDLSHPMESINRGITKACEDFCKAVRDADTKIKENVSRNGWECTLEANVEVNKDLLEKVCGIVPVEEEHKLKYGDAVRLLWCDYDYMYIEPDNEEGTVVRMFDPKNHAIATTHIGNVRYNGGQILVCGEDDLRKIWKDKK